MPNVEIKLDLAALDRISRAVQDAALEAVGEVRTDIQTAQVVPMNNGELQGSMNISQIVEGNDVITSLNTDEAYARFLYHGKLMVAENGSSWAKKGETKTVTEKPLEFQKGKKSQCASRMVEALAPRWRARGMRKRSLCEMPGR